MARTPKQSKGQKQTVARVMHEFKQGELEIRGGRKVKDPKQAIAIALHEAGASNQESPQENRHNLRKTKAKERKGETVQAIGRSRPASPRERLGTKVSKAGRAGARAEKTRAELYAEAKHRNIPGRSRMSKSELERALQ
jgi:hypothetical protein